MRITMSLRARIRTSEQEGIEPGILRAVEAPSAVQKPPLDALVLVTEWKQRHQPYLRRTHASVPIPVMFNARNFYDAKQLVGQAFL
jgi:UDPglucose 6-dehydrogenase